MKKTCKYHFLVWGMLALIMSGLPMQAEAVSFGAATNVAAGTSPLGVVSADFNGDGKADVAAANFTSSNISILIGDGLGGFAAAATISATGTTSAAAVTSGDFNADGNADLAVANNTSSNMSVFLGDGLGGFGTATNFTAGNRPNGILNVDFNGDGNLDIAVANTQSNNISVFLGDGTGAFAVAVNVAVGTGPVLITNADFNRDGNPDIAVANKTSNDVSVLLGDGAGGFAAVVNFAAGTGAFAVTSADFNRDGKPDLAVANQTSNDVSVLLGDGAGGFAAAVNFAAGTLPQSVASADLNGDGKSDLVVANQTSNDVSVLLGDGAGGFAAAANFAAGTGAQSVISTDFNRDGSLDLAVANLTSNDVSILLNQADTTAPTGTISIDAGNAFTNTTSVTLTLTCSDDVACTQMQFSSDDVTYTALTANATSAAFTLTAGVDGIRTVFARFTDAAGNVSTAVSDTITLDTLAPAQAVITTPVNTTGAGILRPVISGTAEANSSVVVRDGAISLGLITTTAGGVWTLAGGGATLTLGGHSFTATATDQAGNAGPVSTAVSYSVVESVINSGGCTINPRASFDPLLLVLLLLSGLYGMQRYKKSSSKR